MAKKIFSICLVVAMIFAFVGCADINQPVIDQLAGYKGYINISGVACEISTQYANFDAFFLEGWVPGNTWDAKGTNKATVDSEGKAKYVFDEPLKVEDDAIGLQLRVIVDSSNFWDAPFNKVNGNGQFSIDNPKDGKTYTLLWKDDALTLVED